MHDLKILVREDFGFVGFIVSRSLKFLFSLSCFIWVSNAVANEDWEVRAWKGKNGESFRGMFIFEDDDTGQYVFDKGEGNTIRIDPKNLSDEDAKVISDILKARKAAIVTVSPLKVDKELKFSSEPMYERKWRNTEGKVITASLSDVTNDSVTFLMGEREAKVELQGLHPEDQVAALLWTGTTDEPLEFPQATFQYLVIREEKIISRFKIEVNGVFSCISTDDVAVDSTGARHAYEQRIITDHSNGTYQRETKWEGKDWIKGSYGRLNQLQREGGVVGSVKTRYEEIIEKFPDAEMAASGRWLVRSLTLGKELPGMNEKSEVSFLCLSGSHLPTVLSFVVSSPTLMHLEPASKGGMKTVKTLPYSFGSNLGLQPLSGMLETMRLKDLVVVDVTSDMASTGKTTLSLESVLFEAPDIEEFNIDPKAVSLEEGFSGEPKKRKR